MSLIHDLLFGLRTLRRSPGFTLIAVLTLALAVGANAALFSVVNAVLLRGFGYAEPERLVQIGGITKLGRQTGVSIPDFVAIQQRAHSFERVATSRVNTFTLTGPHEPENDYAQMVTADCFAALDAHPMMGRVLAAVDFESSAAPVTVISQQLWRNTFEGDPQIVGRRVLMNGEAYTIVGVMRPEFQYPHPVFQIWAPWKLSAENLANHVAFPYAVLARLRRGVSRAQAQAELDALSVALGREFPATNAGWHAVLTPVSELYIGNLRQALWILTGAVGFVLLIACINVGNLLLARGVARSREWAVRAAMGASRARLVRQLLTESLLIAIAGCAGGLLLARWWLRALLATLPERAIPVLPRADRASLDGRVLLVSIAACIVTAIVFGLVPALQVSRPNLGEALKEGGRANSGSGRKRRLLGACVLLETALSVVLLAGAGVMLRSFDNLTNVAPGFHPEHVLTLQIPSAWYESGRGPDAARRVEYFRQVVERAQTVPVVSAAAIVTVLPLGAVQIQTRIFIQGRVAVPGEDIRVPYRGITPDYFRAMGIPLLRGRAFNAQDRSGRPTVAIVSEALARRYWPNEDAVGKQLSFGGPNGPWAPIVGVVGSVHFDSLNVDPEPEVYTSYSQLLLASQVATVVLRTAADPLTMIPAARALIRQLDPNQPIADVKTMTQAVADSVAKPRFYTLLLAIFAGLALTLAAAGIFSVVAWTVNQATHEIGIRMALGSTPRDVLGGVLRRVLIESMAGVAAGLAGAAMLTRLLKTQLFGVAPADPATFAAVAALLALVALAAGYIPARRATRVDPMVALRNE